MDTAIASLVRILAMGAALAAYYAALPFLFPDDGGGANIGAGLIAFGALVLISFGWAFVDGHARGISPTLIVWAIVAGDAGYLELHNRPQRLCIAVEQLVTGREAEPLEGVELSRQPCP